MTDQTDWLKPKEASRILQVPLMTVYAWIYRGYITGEKRKGWLIDPASLSQKETERSGRVVINLMALKENLSQAVQTVDAILKFEKKKRSKALLRGVKE